MPLGDEGPIAGEFLDTVVVSHVNVAIFVRGDGKDHGIPE